MRLKDLNKEYMETAYRLYSLFEMRSDNLRRRRDVIFDFHYRQEEKKEKDKDKLREINLRIKSTNYKLLRIAKEAQRKGIHIPIEDIVKENDLNPEERNILLSIYFNELEEGRFEINGRGLLKLLGYQPVQFAEKCVILQNLLKKELLECDSRYLEDGSILEAEFALSPHIFNFITGNRMTIDEVKDNSHSSRTTINHKDLKDRSRRGHRLLNIYDPVLSFDQIVLEPAKLKEIERAIFQAKNLNLIFEEWGLNETIKYGKGTVMLFYGPPGTGKTATSEAIANRLGKKIGIVNYENILGCWVGDSEKNLVSIFEEAKKEDCVVVFDEADALFAKRFYETYSTDRMHNYMTNILMKKIERFDGVVILTTNREVVVDEAFERRIILKLKFDIPGPEERAKIWRKLIPEKLPLASDVDFEKLGKIYELTGGEIKNAILNAVTECAYRGEKHLKMELLEEFAQKETMRLKGRNIKQLGFKSR